MICNISKFTALLALPILAVATPWGSPTTTPAAPTTVTVSVQSILQEYLTLTCSSKVTATSTATPVSSCSTGAVQCCDSSSSASDPSTAAILGLVSRLTLLPPTTRSFKFYFCSLVLSWRVLTSSLVSPAPRLLSSVWAEVTALLRHSAAKTTRSVSFYHDN